MEIGAYNTSGMESSPSRAQSKTGEILCTISRGSAVAAEFALGGRVSSAPTLFDPTHAPYCFERALSWIKAPTSGGCAEAPRLFRFITFILQVTACHVLLQCAFCDKGMSGSGS
jgi:hypothetical protein